MKPIIGFQGFFSESKGENLLAAPTIEVWVLKIQCIKKKNVFFPRTRQTFFDFKIVKISVSTRHFIIAIPTTMNDKEKKIESYCYATVVAIVKNTGGMLYHDRPCAYTRQPSDIY